MNENVSELKPHSAESTLQEIRAFLKDEEILEEYDESDVALEARSSDESYVGELNYTERHFFMIGQLLRQIIRDELVELEASNTDVISRIMRERKISAAQALVVMQQEHTYTVSDEQAELVNTCNVIGTLAISQFEFSFRKRFSLWRYPLIVREGFRAFTHHEG